MQLDPSRLNAAIQSLNNPVQEAQQAPDVPTTIEAPEEPRLEPIGREQNLDRSRLNEIVRGVSMDSERLRQATEEQAAFARRQLEAQRDVTPEVANQIREVARATGFSESLLARPGMLDRVTEQQAEEVLQDALRQAPVTSRLFSDPDVARIARESAVDVASIEAAFEEGGFAAASRQARAEQDRRLALDEELEDRASRPVMVEAPEPEKTLRDHADRYVELQRRFLGGPLQFAGSGLSGLGESYDIAVRGLENALRLTFGDERIDAFVEATTFEGINLNPGDWFLRNPGEAIKNLQELVEGTKPEDPDFWADVAGGVGQLAGMVLLATTPAGAQALPAMLFGQGADIMGEKIAEDEADQWRKDFATLTGGIILGVTQKISVDVLMSRLAAPFTNRVAAYLARLGTAGAAEGVQEITENVLMDLTRIALTNPDAEIEFAEAMHEGQVGFTVGAIARAMVETTLGIRGRAARTKVEREIDEVQDLMRRAINAKESGTPPDSLAQMLGEVTEGSTVFIDPDALRGALEQGGLEPDFLPAFRDYLASPEAQNEAGPGVEIPVGELLARVSGTPAEQSILQNIRMQPDAMSLAEAQADSDAARRALEADAERILQNVETREQIAQEARTIEDSIADQVTAAAIDGIGPQAARSYGKLISAFYTSLSDRLGLTPLQLRDGWTDAQGVQHQGYNLRIAGAPDTTASDRAFTQRPAATRETFTAAGIDSLLSTRDWVLITAENPNGQALDPVTNAARQDQMRADLDAMGIEYIEGSVGQYNSIENPFILLNVTPRRAAELARKYDQESALTPAGLVYQDGTVEVATGLTKHETRPEDYFTTLPDGTLFTVDLDFSQRVPLSQTPYGQELEGLAQHIERTNEQIARDAEDIATNDPTIVRRYVERFGYVVDPDQAKQMFPEYNADPLRMASVVHEASSILAKRVYADLLANRPKGLPVLFSAGGGGSGKSETFKRVFPDMQQDAAALYDSVLGNYDSAKSRIEKALASGREVRVVYTNRQAMKAWQFALKRERIVPVDHLAKGHTGASDTVRRLAQEYAGNDNVSILVSNNITDSLDDLAAGTVADVFQYKHNELVTELINEAWRQYETGELSLERLKVAIGEARVAERLGEEVARGADRQGEGQVQGDVLGAGAADAGPGGLGAGSFSQTRGAGPAERIEVGKLVEQSGPLSPEQWQDLRQIALDRLTPEEREAYLASEAEQDRAKEQAEADSERFRAVAAEKLANTPTPRLSTVPLMTGAKTLNAKATGSKAKPSVKDLALALMARVKNSAASVGSKAGRTQIARGLYHEVLYALSQDGHAVGWYDRKVKEALSVSSIIHPELLTDPQSNFTFRMIAAITSNGQAVRDNFALANKVYRRWKREGKLPEDMDDGGARREGMLNGFARFNEMVEDLGWEVAQEEMLRLRSVGDITKAFGLKISGENAGAMVPTAVAVGGPKIGNFFANLSGYFLSPTMDLWFMRTVGRMTGDLRQMGPRLWKGTTEKGEFKPAHLDTLLSLLPEKGKINDIPVATIRKEIETFKALPDEQKADVFIGLRTLKNTRLHAERQYSKFASPDKKGKTYTDKSPLNINARSLMANLAAGHEAPGNGTERANLRLVVEEAQRLLAKDGIELNAADFQAVLWYYEKNLYAKTGGISANAKPWDYANAAQFAVGVELGLVDVGSRQRADELRRGELDEADAAILEELESDAASGESFAQSATEERLTRPPVNEDGTVTLQHYGKVPALSELDPGMSGTGLRGQDLRRRDSDPDNWQDRTYYGMAIGQPGGYVKESGVGPHMYEARIPADKLYDMARDPDGLRPKPTELGGWDNATSVFEKRIKEAGYTGYWVASPQLGLTAAVFEKLPAKQLEGFAQRQTKTRELPGARTEFISPDGQIILTFGYDPVGEITMGLDALPGAQRGTGTATKLFLEGLAEYGRRYPTAEFVSEKILSDDTVRLFERLTESGVPFYFEDGAYRLPNFDLQALSRQEAVFQKLPAEQVEGFTQRQTETEAFKKWFGDSNLLNEDGTPLVIYHGTTTGDIDTFRPSETGAMGPGVYFGDSVEVAEAYAGDSPGAAVVPAYARGKYLGNMAWSGYVQKHGWEGARAAAEKDGFAGVRDTKFESAVVVWDPANIKSAIGNQGTFDPTDPSIVRQDRRAEFVPSQMQINLLEAADLSSFLHEAGHFFLQVYTDLAAQPDAPAEIRQDMEKLLDWMAPGTTPEQWAQMSVEQQREGHERFAESFEAYLFEGKAPNKDLRAVFQRFAKWLTRVYGSLRSFLEGPGQRAKELNPEIREVMDRMLSTEAAIEEAAQRQNYVAIFESAAEAGMTPEQFAEYLSLDADARAAAEEQLRTRSLRELRWLRRMQNNKVRELQKEMDVARAEIEQEIEQDLRQQPVYRAIEWLRYGRMETPSGERIEAQAGFRLAIDAVDSLFPAGAVEGAPQWRKLGYGKYGMLAKEGLHPDIVAEMFGFPSGRDLVMQLLEARPLAEEVQGLADQRMLERFGELVTPEGKRDAADEALHNDARVRMTAVELRTLDRLRGGLQGLLSAAREFGKAVVERKTPKTLKPNAFATAARKASQEAMAALRKGDRDAAAKFKRAELLNQAATKAAYEATNEIRKIKQALTRIAKAKLDDATAKTRDLDLVSLAQILVARHGFATPRQLKAANEYADLVRKNNPELAPIVEEYIQALNEPATDWKDMSLSQLRDLQERADQLWFLSRRSREVELGGKRMSFDAARDSLVAKVEENGLPDRAPGSDSAVTKAEARKMTFQTFMAKIKRVAQWATGMDGSDSGPFRNLIWYPVKDAADTYRLQRMQYLRQYRELLKMVEPTLKPGLISASELGYTFGKGHSGVGKMELLHAILHTGNDSNKRKLLVGRGWGSLDQDGNLDSSKWDAFLARMINEGQITKTDMDFVQGVWDLLESMKPAAQKAHRAVFGRYFNEITADKIETPWGTYRGGYVPATVDTAIVTDARRRELANLENENMTYAFPAASSGFTKARVDYDRPLALDLRLLSTHMDKVLIFSNLQPVVNDVNRLLRDPELSKKLELQQPGVLNGMLVPWLNRAAKQIVEDPSDSGALIDGMMRNLRRNTGAGLMFANTINALQQFTGLALSVVKIKPRYLGAGMAHMAARPLETIKFIKERSVFMQDRLDNTNALLYEQVNEILVNPSKFKRAQDWSLRHAYIFQIMADRTISPMVWLGAYNQALESAPADLTGDALETHARRAADSAVQETQMDQSPEGIAAFESGPAWRRLFTQFAGWFNMSANTMASEIKLARKSDGTMAEKAGRIAFVLAFGWFIPGALSEMIAMALRGAPEDEEGDGPLDDWLEQIGWGVLKYGTAMVPYFGQFANASVSTFTENPFDARMGSTPVFGAIEAGARTVGWLGQMVIDPESVEGKRPGRVIRDAGFAINAMTGLPTNAISKPLAYAMDVEEGFVDPSSDIDYVRGMITGTASPGTR